MAKRRDSRFPDIGGGVAIISGTGALPRLLAEACERRKLNYRVVVFEGIEPDWAAGHPVIRATFEQIGRMFRDIQASGCTTAVFAGGMARPRLDPARIDPREAGRYSQMQAALGKGDDQTLRFFTGLFEAQGLAVLGPHVILSDLIARPGVLSALSPSPTDRQDAARAAEIVRALGAVDVGQGAVVAQGICLAVESIQGTDRMLAFVAETRDGFLPDPNGASGVLYKAPKPGQDRRVDLPAIGADTMRAAAAAGLAGVVLEAGGSLILERADTVAEADRLGLFLWGRESTEN